MTEDQHITMRCSRCRKDTAHAFAGMMDGLYRYQCQPCGRNRLLTVKERA